MPSTSVLVSPEANISLMLRLKRVLKSSQVSLAGKLEAGPEINGWNMFSVVRRSDIVVCRS